MLPLAVPLAVCEAAEALRPGIECGVKWPNDVHVDGRKLAGILIEARPQDGWAVIGVGLNLTIAPEEFPPDLRDTAVSIFAPTSGVAGSPAGASPLLLRRTLPDPATAAEVLSRHLERWVEADPDAVLESWRERDALHGPRGRLGRRLRRRRRRRRPGLPSRPSPPAATASPSVPARSTSPAAD